LKEKDGRRGGDPRTSENEGEERVAQQQTVKDGLPTAKREGKRPVDLEGGWDTNPKPGEDEYSYEKGSSNWCEQGRGTKNAKNKGRWEKEVNVGRKNTDNTGSRVPGRV